MDEKVNRRGFVRNVLGLLAAPVAVLGAGLLAKTGSQSAVDYSTLTAEQVVGLHETYVYGAGLSSVFNIRDLDASWVAKGYRASWHENGKSHSCP